MSSLGVADWQEIARWIGPTLDQQSALAIGAGTYDTATFQVGSFESCLLICKPTGGTITATFTSTVTGAPAGLQVKQVVTFAAGVVGFKTVPNIGDNCQVHLAGSIAGETVDFALIETNAGGTLASTGLNGLELAYAENAGNVALAGATITQLVALPSVTMDGVTPIYLECFVPEWTMGNGNPGNLYLYDNGVQLLRVARTLNATTDNRLPLLAARRFVPAAGAHIYDFRGLSNIASTAQGLTGEDGAAIGPIWARASSVAL